MCRLGDGEAKAVTLGEGATAGDALAAGGYVGAVLVHDGATLLQSQRLADVGVAAGAQLSVVSLPAGNTGLLTLTGMTKTTVQQVLEALQSAEHPPLEIAQVMDDILCFYHTISDAEAAKATTAVQQVLADEDKKRRAAKSSGFGTFISASADSCLSDAPGIAFYHLEALKSAAEENALENLEVSPQVQSELLALVSSVSARGGEPVEEAEPIDLATKQAEQCRCAALQLHILQAFLAAKSEDEMSEDLRTQANSLVTVLGMIVSGRFGMHVDRFAETFAQLGAVTGLEAFQIETE